jgi:Kef-type K+ transport system membrane component KefB
MSMTAAQVGSLLAGLAVIVTLARLLGAVFRRIGQPPVVGEILAGVLLGPTFFGLGLENHLFPAVQVRPALEGLANVGLVLFMFIVGYELDTSMTRSQSGQAVAISLGSIVVPLGLGTGLGFWLASQQHIAKHVPFALFIGVAMSITAFPVLARILTDRGMQRTKLGNLALASAAVGDVTAWVLLALVVVIAKTSSGSSQWKILLLIPYLALMIFAVRPLLKQLGNRRNKAGRLTPDLLAVVIVGLVLSAYATQWMGLHYIFGAFLFGAFMPRIEAQEMQHEILERLEQLSVIVLLPVYFVLAGLAVNLSTFGLQTAGDLGLILVAAIGGKFIGAYVAARLRGVKNRQAGALATLMNTRGLTEIVILTVGLQLHILNITLYSLMVIMALVTTAMTGPIMQLVYPSRLIERDITEANQAELGEAVAYRVMVATTDSALDQNLVAIGAALARGHSPAEVVVTRLLPYRTRRLEVGTGLSGELVEMTQAMSQLEALAKPWRSESLTVSVIARFSNDLVGDLIGQVNSSGAAILVLSDHQPGYDRIADEARARLVAVAPNAPLSWPAVLVRAGSAPSSRAAVEVGVLLAATQGARLMLDAGGRAAKRLEAIVAEVGKVGLAAAVSADGGDGALIVSADGGSVVDAHVKVHAEPGFAEEEPEALARALEAAGVSSGAAAAADAG